MDVYVVVDESSEMGNCIIGIYYALESAFNSVNELRKEDPEGNFIIYKREVE